jgi:asparagine synthase (glutamine-hydrolysing)
MCGIFGFKLHRPLTNQDIALGRRGTAMLSHRGPDAEGEWFDHATGTYLGHRRLSIIDLRAENNQPMERGHAHIAFNGEIYNFKELQKELSAQGVSFSTSGDTEVLLRAWSTWGRDTLHRLDGMFAFAIAQDDSIHLATDPFGEKPLYFATTADGVYFASEILPLATLLKKSRHLTQDEFGAFLSLGFLPSPSTGYADISRMPPATYMEIDRKGFHQHRYWTPPEPHRQINDKRNISSADLDVIHDALLSSLRTRVYSDVPVGLFLSAGVDSSLIAAMLAKDLKILTQALTVAFPDGQDESLAAEKIAKHLGLPHRIINSLENPRVGDIPALIDLFGEPNDNVTIFSFQQMSELAREHIKVALSGMGGDELFYGYGRYHFFHRYRRFLDLPKGVRKALAACVNVLPARWRQSSVGRLLTSSDALRMITVKNGDASGWLNAIPAVNHFARTFFTDTPKPLYVGSRQFDMLHTLPDSYIPANERGSMRASLEVRTPYLNRRLYELLCTYPQSAFFTHGPKWVLRRILSRYIPDHLMNRPKQGFAYPKLRLTQQLLPQHISLPMLSEAHTRQVWNKPLNQNWQTIQLRLVMLSQWLETPLKEFRFERLVSK